VPVRRFFHCGVYTTRCRACRKYDFYLVKRGFARYEPPQARISCGRTALGKVLIPLKAALAACFRTPCLTAESPFFRSPHSHLKRRDIDARAGPWADAAA
jgi:hypothetical protein